MGTFAVLRRNDLQPCFLAKFEFVRFRWSAWANKTLPFRCTRNVFYVSAVAVGSRLLYAVLRVATRALNKQPCFLHGELGGSGS
jgi:hypothetical protein